MIQTDLCFVQIILCCILCEYRIETIQGKFKNISGMDRYGKELSQIRKGEVMLLDKTEPDVLSVILLKKHQALICYFLCCLLSATAHSVIISKKTLKLMENVAVKKTGTTMEEMCGSVFLLKEQYIPKNLTNIKYRSFFNDFLE